MLCSPAGTPVPSEARHVTVVLGKPAVNVRSDRPPRKGATSGGPQEIGARLVDAQDATGGRRPQGQIRSDSPATPSTPAPREQGRPARRRRSAG